MKCANCGAELKVGCIYCAVCGHEAQIVSDYNILEDELLNSLLNEEKKANTKPEAKPPAAAKQPKEPPKKKKKNMVPFVIAGVTLVIVLALTIFMGIRSSRNNSFDYQYSQGLVAKSNGDYTKAIQYFKRALELDEDNVDVMLELAKIYEKRETYDLEEKMLLQIISLDKQNREAYTMLIKLYDTQKKYEKIMALYESQKDTSLKSLFTDYLVVSPEFSQEPGTYDEEFEVKITSNASGEIYYSFGDTDPTVSGIKYVSPLKITEGDTKINAVIKDSRGLYSDIITAEYRVKFIAPSEPQVSPRSGAYTERQQIVITVPENCTAYYTWDGSTPTDSSIPYAGSFEMREGNNVLSIIVYDSHGLSSKVVKYNYIYLPEVLEDEAADDYME